MIYLTPPEDFKTSFEVVNCYVEWEGKILLLRRNVRKPQGGTWGPPAGKIERAETPQETMIRELQEETGIEVSKKQIHLGSKIYIRYPSVDYVYNIFYSRVKDEPIVRLNSEEYSSYVWVSPTKALLLELVPDEGNAIKLFFKL